MTAPAHLAVNPYVTTSIILPQDENERVIRTTNYLTEIALKVNQREIATYDFTELVTGQSWPSPTNNPFSRRQVFRQLYTFGTIAAGVTLNIGHNIQFFTAFTHIYGTCITDVPDFRPLPYVDVTNVTNQISVKVTPTNIVIVNGATSANITSGFIILEYLKN